jgi:hypothetical protein
VASEEQRCTECGLRSGPGEPNCAELRDALLARDFEQGALYGRWHRLAVDSYCVQHGPYVLSAKSLAAHLCGLCIAFERNADQAQLATLQRWLSTNPPIGKPELPTHRGALTIAHVSGIEDPAAYGDAVHEWARSSWEAYHALHPLARDWIALSSAHRR